MLLLFSADVCTKERAGKSAEIVCASKKLWATLAVVLATLAIVMLAIAVVALLATAPLVESAWSLGHPFGQRLRADDCTSVPLLRTRISY